MNMLMKSTIALLLAGGLDPRACRDHGADERAGRHDVRS